MYVDRLEKIDFDTAISFKSRGKHKQKENKGMLCILVGYAPQKIQGNSRLARNIRAGNEVDFKEANTLIHKQFQELEYIEFWENTNIYREYQ